MTLITNTGYYFTGKVKDLSLHLKMLAKKYPTIKTLINKNLQ